MMKIRPYPPILFFAAQAHFFSLKCLEILFKVLDSVGIDAIPTVALGVAMALSC